MSATLFVKFDGPSQFKVVDRNGRVAARHFVSRQAAERFIEKMTPKQHGA